jgi:hypothetical protein
MSLDPRTADALEAGGLCDITTMGARSGRAHRIEMAFHHIDGEFFITGRPGLPRDWLANLKANPDFTIHLRMGTDVTAHAEEITDRDERTRLLYRIRTEGWGVDPAEAQATNETWVDSSPLVRFTVDG